MQWEEIVLRLHAVSTLDNLQTSQLLTDIKSNACSLEVLLNKLCLTKRQRKQFFRVESHYITTSLRWLEQSDHHLVIYNQQEYPECLRHIDLPPLCLLVKGDISVLNCPQIAMVGSRQFSYYGERWARIFASNLAQNGFIITSGLAIGIDGICHRAALEAGGRSIAVLGSGLSNIYPRRHQQLACQLIEQGGALISEYLVTDLPLADHFPRRNRIISGLSLGVLVVEASLRSGSLITARYAMEQGREVFALPGPLDNPMNEGTHWLIQQGASLVTAPQEVIEQLNQGFKWLPKQKNTTISSSEAEVGLPFPEVLANVEEGVTPIDVVAARAGQPVPEVAIKLLDLELAGWIAAVPGGYVRIRRAGHVRRTHVLI